MPSNKELQAQVTALRGEVDKLRKEADSLHAENGDLKNLLKGDEAAGALHTEVQQLKEELEATRGTLSRVHGESLAMQASFDETEAKWQARFAELDALEAEPVSSGPHLLAGEAVVLRRPARVGDRQCEPGERLGVVMLAEGVSLNYLVDALRNDLAKGEPFSVDEDELDDNDNEAE